MAPRRHRIATAPAHAEKGTAYVTVGRRGLGTRRYTRLVAIDTATGQQRGRVNFGERTVVDSAILDDKVIVLLDGGELLALSDEPSR